MAGAGAGKTTFAELLAERLRAEVGSVTVLHTDLFYRPYGERWNGRWPEEQPLADDYDWRRLRDEVLLPLRAGESARFQLYNWPLDRLEEWVEIPAGAVTIVEGVTAIRRENAGYYDLRAWFSCPRATRARRMLGRGDTFQYELDYWFPIEERYRQEHRPERAAHLVIDSAAEGSEGAYGWVARSWVPPTLR